MGTSLNRISKQTRGLVPCERNYGYKFKRFENQCRSAFTLNVSYAFMLGIA